MVGGVEAVVQAHTSLLLEAGYSVRLVAGVGEESALPQAVEFIRIPEMDSLHPQIVHASQQLEAGIIPDDFEALSTSLEKSLALALQGMDNVIIHNLFTKHFNLPLTAALMRLLDQGRVSHCIAWCHDFTWTSPHSWSSVHPGYPWDLLRTYRKEVTYVTVSLRRQSELAGLLGCAPESVHVVYNGVDPVELYSLSQQGQALSEQLELGGADLILLMPVRITQAKNIELGLQVTANLKAMGIHPKLVITGPPDPHDPENMVYYHSLLDLRRKLDIEREAAFVYSMSPQVEAGYTIGLPLLRELYRACDALFIPSHREGFGIPILEAGLNGMPIFSTGIPAADEIGGDDVTRFLVDASANQVADLILSWARSSSTQRLRQRVRKNFTWQAIFQHDILPLMVRGEIA